jgi:hypothetical protein
MNCHDCSYQSECTGPCNFSINKRKNTDPPDCDGMGTLYYEESTEEELNNTKNLWTELGDFQLEEIKKDKIKSLKKQYEEYLNITRKFLEKKKRKRGD